MKFKLLSIAQSLGDSLSRYSKVLSENFYQNLVICDYPSGLRQKLALQPFGHLTADVAAGISIALTFVEIAINNIFLGGNVSIF